MQASDPARHSPKMPEGAFGSVHLRVVTLCALVAALDGFDAQAIAYIAPAIAQDWRLDVSSFGPVFSSGLAGLMIGAFLFSPISDRIGRKRVILASTLLFGLASLATAVVDGLPALIVLRLVTGIGLGGAMPNLIALTNEYAPQRLKSRLVTVMFCGFPLGSTFGGFASANLIEQFGWRSVLVIGGLLPLLLLPVLVLLLPESLRFLAVSSSSKRRFGPPLERNDAAYTAPLSGRGRSEGRWDWKAPLLALFAPERARTTVLLWLAFFMNLLVMYFLVNWLPSLLKSEGLPLRIAIMATALLNLGGVVGAIALGPLLDRHNAFKVLAAAYAGSAAVIAVLALGTSIAPLALAAAAAAGVGVVGAQIGLNAVTAAAYPPEMRATGIGWALGVGRLGSIIGPLAGGALLGAGWSSRDLILCAVGPALIAALALALLARSPRADALPELVVDPR